jgi:hypothetical protein
MNVLISLKIFNYVWIRQRCDIKVKLITCRTIVNIDETKPLRCYNSSVLVIGDRDPRRLGELLNISVHSVREVYQFLHIFMQFKLRQSSSMFSISCSRSPIKKEETFSRKPVKFKFGSFNLRSIHTFENMNYSNISTTLPDILSLYLYIS